MGRSYSCVIPAGCLSGQKVVSGKDIPLLKGERPGVRKICSVEYGARARRPPFFLDRGARGNHGEAGLTYLVQVLFEGPGLDLKEKKE